MEDIRIRAIILVCSILIILNIISGRDSSQLMIIIFTYFGINEILEYKKTRKRIYIAGAILFGLCILVDFVEYIMIVVKK